MILKGDYQDDKGNSVLFGANPDTPIKYEVASEKENIKSGDSLGVICGKVEKWFGESDKEIAAMKESFQDGCNTIVSGCTTYGAAPAGNSPEQIVAAIGKIYEERYNDGHSAGQESGYNNGFSAGRTEGYNAGYSDGQDAGYNAGYSQGVNDADGKLNKESVSYETGYQNGYNEGVAAGRPFTIYDWSVWSGVSAGTQIYADLTNYSTVTFVGIAGETSDDRFSGPGEGNANNIGIIHRIVSEGLNGQNMTYDVSAMTGVQQVVIAVATGRVSFSRIEFR